MKIALLLSFLSLAEAFVVPNPSTSTTSLFVGGKGWENNGYLDSLGGNDDDREQAQQDYQAFHETRQAFLKRQEERMKTPEAQRFLKQQQRLNEQQWQAPSLDEEDDFPLDEDEFEDLGASSGGSIFRQMMQKSKRMQQRMGQPNNAFIDPSTGLEQKFVVPLDDDEDGMAPN